MRNKNHQSFSNWAIATTYREGAVTAITKHAEEKGLLDVVFTATPLGGLDRIGQHFPQRFRRIQNALTKRTFEFLPESRVHHTITLNEFAHVAVRRLAGDRLGLSSRLMYWVKETFDREVATQIRGNLKADVLIGMWGSSAESFGAAGTRLKVLNFVNSRPSEHNRLLAEFAGLPSSHSEMVPARVGERVEEEMRLADIILVPSRFLANQMPEYLAKVVIIPYGVNPLIFSGGEANQKRTIDSEFKPVHVLFTGQISHRKGISTLMEAARHLPTTRFTLVGPLVSRAVLAGAPSNVTYRGSVSHHDVARFMQDADIFVLPSFEDTYGLVILEAMACGKPVIVSRNCGAAEIITHEENGLVFEAGNPADLTNCLEKLGSSQSIRKQLGASGQGLVVRESHNWETYGQRVADAIQLARWKN